MTDPKLQHAAEEYAKGAFTDANFKLEEVVKFGFLAGARHMEAENTRLREALGFYADRLSWVNVSQPHNDTSKEFDIMPHDIDTDGPGKRAREALKRTEVGK